jgi:nucleotide-binding universal stress UspA family protein
MNGDPIVVGYDGSDGSRAAVHWALDEGARRHLPVRLIHVVEHRWRLPATLTTATVALGADLVDQTESMLDKVAAEAKAEAPGVEVTRTVRAGSISGTLCEESGRADMVVLGSRGTGGFAGLPVGSVSVAVATHARCPVVVVRDGAQPSNLPIVVGVEDCVEARLAVGFAFQEAAARAVPLVAIRAWESPTSPWRSDRWPRGLGTDEVELAERNLASAILHESSQPYPSVQVSVHTMRATPTHALEVASRGAQLLVVGCRGAGGFHGLLMGSVSLHVLHHAHCPVAVLRQHAAPPDGAATVTESHREGTMTR